MGRVVEFYKTQIRLIWEWKGGPAALVKRGVITFAVVAVSFLLTAAILPGFSIARLSDAAIAIVLVALFNALIRPVLLALVAPYSLILTAVLVLVLQVAAFYVVAQWSPGVVLDSISWAVIASFVYAVINSALTALLGVDRGGSYYGTLVQTLRARGAGPARQDPGVVIIQIDGLAHPILAARIRAGSVNTMAGWMRSGSHKLSRWEALLPSMTSAGQMGILHGTNDGIPAFRWYERDRQKLMVSSNPKDAAEMVRRASNGEGLLSNDGVSICNLVNGDATRSYLTTAALAEARRASATAGRSTTFFLSPSGYLHSVTLFFAEFIKERYQARRTRRAGITPQLHRGMKYAGMRAASNVLLRDINVSLIIEEMYRGANVIYADFTDYDEIAHHSGPERVEALQAHRRDRHRARDAREGHGRHAAAVPLRGPVGSRPEPRRHLQAALRREPRGPDPAAHGWTGVGRPDVDDRGGLGLRQRVPVGDHARPWAPAPRSRARRCRAGRRTASSTSMTRSPSTRRPRTARSPSSDRATLVSSTSPARPPPDPRGARGDPSGPGIEPGRTPGREHGVGPFRDAGRDRVRDGRPPLPRRRPGGGHRSDREVRAQHAAASGSRTR